MEMFDAEKNAGDVLRRLIKERKLTQDEFAYDFGVDVRTANRWINDGINKISIVQELAIYFDVQITDFFKK